MFVPLFASGRSMVGSSSAHCVMVDTGLHLLSNQVLSVVSRSLYLNSFMPLATSYRPR